MSRVLNLAKGRTYICTTSENATITMGAITVTIDAPQGLFVATDEVGTIDKDSAVVKQLFYSSAASGIGAKPLKMAPGTTIDPTNTEYAVNGLQVGNAIQAAIGEGLKVEIWTNPDPEKPYDPPTPEQALYNTIYLVPAKGSIAPDIDYYDEYIKIKKGDTDVVERIGSTALKVEDVIEQDNPNPVSSGAVYEATHFIDRVDGSEEVNVILSDTTGSGVRFETVDNAGTKETKIATVTKTGETYTQGSSFTVEDAATLIDYAYVQEAASDIPTGDSSVGYIDERIQAFLNSRHPELVTLTNGEAKTLYEDNIGHISTGGGVALNLASVTCAQFATAEIWIDIPSTATATEQQVTFPTATWLELSEPSTLAAGKRHVFVVRNDGMTDSHLVMNYAYSYTL